MTPAERAAWASLPEVFTMRDVRNVTPRESTPWGLLHAMLTAGLVQGAESGQWRKVGETVDTPALGC